MRKLIATALIALTPASALAEARLDTAHLSCAAAQQFVLKNGAALLYSGPDVYDRYVADRRFCLPNQFVRPGRLTDAHEAVRCIVNYKCFDPDNSLPRQLQYLL